MHREEYGKMEFLRRLCNLQDRGAKAEYEPDTEDCDELAADEPKMLSLGGPTLKKKKKCLKPEECFLVGLKESFERQIQWEKASLLQRPPKPREFNDYAGPTRKPDEALCSYPC